MKTEEVSRIKETTHTEEEEERGHVRARARARVMYYLGINLKSLPNKFFTGCGAGSFNLKHRCL